MYCQNVTIYLNNKLIEQLNILKYDFNAKTRNKKTEHPIKLTSSINIDNSNVSDVYSLLKIHDHVKITSVSECVNSFDVIFNIQLEPLEKRLNNNRNIELHTIFNYIKETIERIIIKT